MMEYNMSLLCSLFTVFIMFMYFFLLSRRKFGTRIYPSYLKFCGERERGDDESVRCYGMNEEISMLNKRFPRFVGDVEGLFGCDQFKFIIVRYI